MTEPHASLRGAAVGLLALALGAFAIGCAQTNVDVTRRTLSALPRPDRVVVRDFAVTRSEIELDGGIAPEMVRAVRGDRSTRVSSTTAFIVGQFRTVDEGNQTLRTLVGFGLGGSEVRTHAQVCQGGMLIAEADTSANSGYKPGAGVTLGVGAAAGARRTAREIADKVEEAYKRRGWL